MPASVPTNTTLSVAINASVRRLTLAAVTGITVGGKLVIGREVMNVLAVNSAAVTVDVLRGRDGSQARRHAANAVVYFFASTVQPPQGRDLKVVGGVVMPGGYTGNLGDLPLPVGSEYFDPDTGNTYVLVDSGAAFVVGEWVVISGTGQATQLAIGSKGRVGVIVEAVDASDRLAWALIIGTFASALFDSDVTTGMELGAAAGFAAPYDSTNHVKIERATCTVAPSTATSPTVGDGIGTVYLDRPWVSGVATFVS